MTKNLRILRWALALSTLVASTFAFSMAIKEIKDASAEARAALAVAAEPSPSASQPSTARLETALKRGEEIIASLQSEVESLKAERVQLVQVQTALTSGLIGAVVTALIAIVGAVVNSRNSRPERDLKRLAVLEKAHELQSAGLRLPDDITQTYASESAS